MQLDIEESTPASACHSKFERILAPLHTTNCSDFLFSLNFVPVTDRLTDRNR